MSDSNLDKLRASGVLHKDHEFNERQIAAINKLDHDDVDHLIRIRREADHSVSGGKPIAMYL